MSRLWMVRLGKYGESEQRALDEGVLATGWELGEDLSGAGDRDAILPYLQKEYPDEKAGTLQNWAVQLNQFKNVASVGDLVVTPMKTTGQIAIGRLESEYVQVDGVHPGRRVQWLVTDLPRDAVKQDLLYSLGASQTICEIHRNAAAARFESLAIRRIDPGPNLDRTASPSSREGAAADEEDVSIDLVGLAKQQIESHISANFAGHKFTELIAAILRAQGYQTRVSPAGPDRGIDIVAGQGALGFDGPRLVVQVKSGDIVTDQPTLQGLLGSVQDTYAEHGLIVSWSGFTPPVRQRVNELYFRVRLWGRDDILDAIFATYDRLPEQVRADLPLRRIWTLVPDESGEA